MFSLGSGGGGGGGPGHSWALKWHERSEDSLQYFSYCIENRHFWEASDTHKVVNTTKSGSHGKLTNRWYAASTSYSYASLMHVKFFTCIMCKISLHKMNVWYLPPAGIHGYRVGCIMASVKGVDIKPISHHYHSFPVSWLWISLVTWFLSPLLIGPSIRITKALYTSPFMVRLSTSVFHWLFSHTTHCT